MSEFILLRQGGLSQRETRIAAQYALSHGLQSLVSSTESIDAHASILQSGKALPVGTVDFVRKSMRLAGIREPGSLSYPHPLRFALRRKVLQCLAGEVAGHWFVKPVATKRFSGFVLDPRSSPDQWPECDRVEYAVFQSIPPETPVWISAPVCWRAECRYYILDGEIRGYGRYDDGPDEWPEPDLRKVRAWVRDWASCSGTPVAFSLDAGVLETGETALVECNDAWALGFYTGTLSFSDYILMLSSRWSELLTAR